MEVLIKIGDSGGSKDGQIIACKPDGWLIPGAAMAAWIDGGKEPVVLAEMPQYQSDRLKRRINRLRWERMHTAEEIVAEFVLVKPEDANDTAKVAVAMQEASDRIVLAESDRARMIAEGVDTNWGFEDLKVHFALKLTSTDPHDYIELVDREQGTDHKAVVTAKGRNKIDYATLYDAAKLADIADKEKRLDVDRATAVPRVAVKPIAATVIEVSK